MSRPRPLSRDQRLQLAADCEAMAVELRRDDAGRTQQLLGVLLDDCFASTASGAAATGSGSPAEGSPVEARANAQDSASSEAGRLLERLRRCLADVPLATDQLRQLRGDRKVDLCKECGYPLERGSKVCQRVDPTTERRCGTLRDVVRTCENPLHLNPSGEPVKLLTGEKRYKSVAVDLPGEPEIHECRKCWRYRQRYQRSWGDITRLYPGVDAGVYSSENDPWPNVG